ncbi:MAG: T9SS C-terminal target domain-containing protein, partial [Bacteroidetes bacterium]
GEVRVYNALGEAVEAPVRQEDGALEVDVRHLPKGLYFLTLRDGDRQRTGRFVIAR